MKQLFYISLAILLFTGCVKDELDDVELRNNSFENPELPFITVDRKIPVGTDILWIDVTLHNDRFPASINTDYIAITGTGLDTVVTDKKRSIFIRRQPTGTNNYTVGLFEKETRKISATYSFSYP